jgi:hypothetical protein
MSVDPASIPPHVVDAHNIARANGLGQDEHALARLGIAAALDALMDDEPVTVPDPDDNVREDLLFDVRPSDVLKAVLAR